MVLVSSEMPRCVAFEGPWYYYFTRTSSCLICVEIMHMVSGTACIRNLSYVHTFLISNYLHFNVLLNDTRQHQLFLKFSRAVKYQYTFEFDNCASEGQRVYSTYIRSCQCPFAEYLTRELEKDYAFITCTV